MIARNLRMPWVDCQGPRSRKRWALWRSGDLVALSLVVGIEAHVVFCDIWGLDDDEAREISLWMARVLAEATAGEGAPPRR
jgi:hypothetical protein